MRIDKCIKCGSDHTELIIKVNQEIQDSPVEIIDVYLNCHSCGEETFQYNSTEKLFKIRKQIEPKMKFAMYNGSSKIEVLESLEKLKENYEIELDTLRDLVSNGYIR